MMRTMTFLRNKCLFLTLVCSFLVIDDFFESCHGKSIAERSVDPVIADKPSTASVDDPQVKRYAQQGIDKLSESGQKAELEKILEATFLPPAGKLMYDIKIKVKDDKDCIVHVWRESHSDASVTVDCGKDRRRRATDEPVVEDKPSKGKVDDPQVQKYAQQGVDKLKESGDKVRLDKVLEVTFFPPAGKLMYEIKMNVENEENKDDTKMCTVHVERGSGPDVSIHVECNPKKEKRAVEEMPQVGGSYIADKPVGLDVKSSDIVEFAKEGLKEYAKKYPDSKVEIVEIVEAYYTPVSVFSHNIKVKFEKKKNDEVKTEVCTVYVPSYSAKVPMEVKCGDN